MLEVELKKELTKIKQNSYTINNSYTYFYYATQMLEKIGAIDFELRDDLIYEIFANWIDMNVFTENELCNFLKIAKDNQHLMLNIGSEKSDDIFTRTFSALLIALIINKNHHKNFLSTETIIDTHNTMLNYMNLEKDIRGYINEKGWAHSVAHGSDVLSELVKYNEINRKLLLRTLAIFREKICQGKHVYIDGEPDRINNAVKNIIDRNLLNEEEIIAWIESFKYYIIKDGKIESFHQRINIKNYLRSLYFVVKNYYQKISVINEIESILAYI